MSSWLGWWLSVVFCCLVVLDFCHRNRPPQQPSAMVRLACIILGVASGNFADAFRLPSGSHSIANGLQWSSRPVLPSTAASRTSAQRTNKHSLHLSKSDGEAELASEIESLDTDLAKEIEEALSLAQSALTTEASAAAQEEEVDEEEDIDDIANMLMEKPPSIPPPIPLPPLEEPPESVISLSLEEEDGIPLPPASPPPAAAVEFGEALKKKAAEEFEKMKNMIFGLNEELEEAEASIEKSEDAAALLRKEIDESMQEREKMVKTIESEFAKEKELLVAQIEVASYELKAAMDQSAQDIDNAKSKASRGEKELISRIGYFKKAIDEITAEALEINKEKEEINQSRKSMMDKVIEEGKSRLAKFQKTFQFDIDYAKKVNENLQQMADEAENKVRGIYDEINQLRSERISLSEQIMDVEKNALKEIASLERDLKEDDERYATALQNERDRLDKVIDIAYQAYAINICKKIVEREAVEGEYKDKLRKINMQISAAKAKQESRVKEYLDKLEEQHKKERIAIYQEKFEAISEIRKQMNAELAVEYAKIDGIHQTMRAKIDAVQEQTSQVKAEFEKEMAKKRQVAKEEEEELLSQIEDVRLDMTDKIKTQRRLYEEKRAAYLEEVNGQISDSEVELRQKWRELAVTKQSYNEVSVERNNMIDNVADQQALIDSYEADRTSFRQSLRLTAKVAREKIGSKTRRLLGRDKKKAP